MGVNLCPHANTNMSDITIKLVETEEDMEAAVSIRFRVFVDEQSVPPEIELDEYDAVATHAIALLDGKAVGTGRAIVEGDSARIGRMAVDRPNRRGGVGGLLLRFLETKPRPRVQRNTSSTPRNTSRPSTPPTATPSTETRSWRPASCTSRCGRGRDATSHPHGTSRTGSAFRFPAIGALP